MLVDNYNSKNSKLLPKNINQCYYLIKHSQLGFSKQYEMSDGESIIIKVEYDEDSQNVLPHQLEPLDQIQREIYADHEIKEEIVIGPTRLFNSVTDESIIIKVEYDADSQNVLPDQLEPLDQIQREIYADHEIKEEIVISPTRLLNSVTGSGYEDSSSTQTSDSRTTFDLKESSFKKEIIDTCDKKYKNKSSNQLKKRSQNLSNNDKFPCNFCFRTFLSEQEYTEHKTVHTGVKPFYCEECKKSYSSKNSLTQHLTLHNDKRIFSCDKCDKKFVRNRYLTRHKDLHKQIKPYSCEVCKKKFVRQFNLTRHMQLHSDAKPFQCDICSKRFKTKTLISYHLISHSGDRPFSCKVCEARFINRGNLATHMSSHSDEKPFLCKLCPTACKRQSTLDRHMLLHSKKVCNLCNTKFSSIKSLQKHDCNK